GSSHLPDFFAAVVRLKELLAEAGRDPATFPLSKRIYLSIDDDEARARQSIEAMMHDFYGIDDPQADAWSVAGAPGHVLEPLPRLRGAGLPHLMLNPAPVDLHQFELIATRIAPQL